MNKQALLPALAGSRHGGWLMAILLAVVAGIALSRGLGGYFLLDDYKHLQPLEAYLESESPHALFEYIVGTPTGAARPLSVMTFAAQAESWPAFPEHFLTVNLLLHLCNGLLVFALLQMLLGNRHRWLSVIVTGMWLLSPIHLATVLYTVQRMVLMASGFVLLGLLAYLHGRRVEHRHAWCGKLWMIAGLYGFGGLAVLSKESGVLILVFALLLDWLCCQYGKPAASRFRLLLPAVPLLLAVLTLLLLAPQLAVAYEIRDFTVLERLMTEARVLCRYVVQILLPGMLDYGLFYDDYTISRSLLNPAATLAAIAALITTTLLGIRFRKAFPIAAFGWFWFLGGHLLESTALPLELVFEHRNYLPSLGILLAAASLAALAPERIRDERWRMEIIALCSLLVIGATTLYTATEAGIWGKSYVRAAKWAEQRPDSHRANMQRVLQEFHYSRPEHGLRRLRDLAGTAQEPLPYRMFLLRMLCFKYNEYAAAGELETLKTQVMHDVATAPFDWVPLNSVAQMNKELDADKPTVCDRQLPADIFRGLADNPAYATRRTAIRAELMEMYLKQEKHEEAESIAMELIALEDKHRTWLALARYFARTDRKDQARAIIEQIVVMTPWSNPSRAIAVRLRANAAMKELSL